VDQQGKGWLELVTAYLRQQLASLTYQKNIYDVFSYVISSYVEVKLTCKFCDKLVCTKWPICGMKCRYHLNLQLLFEILLYGECLMKYKEE
jgi:hypothetical protein